MTNQRRLCIIISVGGVEVLPLEVLPHKLPHTQRHTPHTAPPMLLFFTISTMRNITKASAKAFKDAKKFKSPNTEVYDGGSGYIQFYLFGNQIAQVRHNDELNADILLIEDAGRRTNTTKERLNGILDAYGLGYIYQRGKDADKKAARFYVDQFGNVEKWDGWKTFEL